MIRLRHKLLIQMFRVFDQMILVLTGIGIIYFRPEILMRGGKHILEASLQVEDALGILILAIGWIVIFDYYVRYHLDRLVALNTQLRNLLKATSLASFWLMIISVVFTVKSFNLLNILMFFVVVTTIGIASRLFLRVLLLSDRRSGYNYRYLLVVGANERARQMVRKIEAKPELGYKVVGFVAENQDALETWDSQNHTDWSVVGQLDNLRTILSQERVDEIIVCLPMDARFSDIARIVRSARDLGIVVRVIPEFADGTLLRNLHIEELDDEYVVTLFREHLLAQLLVKRLIDAALSLAGLIILLPVMAVVAFLIKLTSPGPVFFVQERVGMNQRHFRLYKFRSMVVDAEQHQSELLAFNERDGPVFKIQKDPRSTKIGRFIRMTSIDELPQLFNVLCGEMSLVGPRPPLPDEVKRYNWQFRKRLCVKPGITCIWQISGRNDVSFERWMQMDLDYIDNWSLWLDLTILFQTIPAVLFARGAS